MDLDDLPPVDRPLERLQFYQAARHLEEERAVVEALIAKRGRGEALTDQEWRWISYSPFGTAGGCPSTAFQLRFGSR